MAVKQVTMHSTNSGDMNEKWNEYAQTGIVTFNVVHREGTEGS